MAKKIIYIGLVITALLCTNSGSGKEGSFHQTPSALVTIQASSGETIEFQTQNGITRQGSEPDISRIPRLPLYVNHDLTESIKRTLQFEISGLQIPSPGAMVTLLVETQEKDPELRDPNLDSYQRKRIPVWETSTWIDSDETTNPTGSRVTFSKTFEETVESGDKGWIRTPTGYFRYEIVIQVVGDSLNTTIYEFQQEYAFLMENQWTAPLPDVPEESAGAAPDELVIYYCNMTRFQKDIEDNSSLIPRRAVDDYVGTVLLPGMIEAFRMQSQDWGFPWYDAWTGNRGDLDAERLSVALTDGKTWYHGQASPSGNSKISINVSGGDNSAYDSLMDGVMSIFHHELFHHQQKNINQYFDGQGWTSGKRNQWQFFSEGTAILASSVAQPEIQFARDSAERVYIKNANFFLANDIGKGFSEINPYYGAMYWRFLYEHCGGMSAGIENPAAGLKIIRRALLSLYQNAEGEAGERATLDDWMPRIMDQALDGSACPFQTYSQSLAAFAQALDTLRYGNGRCQSPGIPEGCGFFDPHSLYTDPPVDTLELIAVSP